MVVLVSVTPFAEWLARVMRPRFGSSRSLLAEALDVHVSTVSSWFSARRNTLPSYGTAVRLADVLGIDRNEVLALCGLPLQDDDTPSEDVQIIPELRVLIRLFSPEQQRELALPAVELANTLREAQARYEAQAPADAQRPADDAPSPPAPPPSR